MITLATVGKILRMYCRDGLSISESSRPTSRSRNTIKTWLKKPEGREPTYQRHSEPGKLSAYAALLVRALSSDAQRPKRDRRTAKVLLAELRAQGYTGGYTLVSGFVRAWRQRGGGPAGVRAAHVRPGGSFPVRLERRKDWWWTGVWRRRQVAHLKLCASRAFLLVAYPSQGHERLFEAHTRCFSALGGIPRRGIYDNMKTAVDKVKPGKARLVNARFAAMASHYLFDTDFCNVASGWKKGVVEKHVQDSRRRIWQAASQRCFGGFPELNGWLLERCRQVWREVRHPDYGDLTVAEMLEHEPPAVMPAPFDGYVETLGRIASTS